MSSVGTVTTQQATVNGALYATNGQGSAATAIALEGQNYYGQIQQLGSDYWGLGYGSVLGTNGTTTIAWNGVNGNVALGNNITNKTTLAGASLVINNGNVGIGTTSPSGKLDVVGVDNSTATNIMTAYSNNLSQGFSIRYDGLHAVGSNADVGVNIIPQGNGSLGLGNSAGTGNITIGNTYTGLITNGATTNLLTGGSVGSVYAYGNSINGQYNTNANGLLYINYEGYNAGTTQFRDTEIANGKNGNVLFVQGSTGNVGIGTTSPTSSLFVQAGANVNPFTVASSSGQSVMVITNQGNVGIGTTNPQFPLDVTGGINLTGRLTLQNIQKINWADNSGLRSNGSSQLVFHFGGSDGAILGYQSLSLYSGVNPPSGGLIVSGNVGIGTTSPTSNLYVQGSGSVNPFNIASSSGTSELYVSTAGNVGIGTTSPTALLSVNAKGTTDPFDIYSTTTGGSVLHVTYQGNVGIGTTSPQATLNVYGSGTTNPFLVSSSSGSTLMVINNQGNVGIGTTSPTSSLFVQAGANVNPFTVASSSGQSVMVVTNQGNVGIGTTAPGAALQVAASNGNGTAITKFTQTNGTASVIVLDNGKMAIGPGTGNPSGNLDITGPTGGATLNLIGANGVNQVQGTIGFNGRASIASIVNSSGNTNYGSLQFFTNDAGGLVEGMRITSTGNVGIGTTNPVLV